MPDAHKSINLRDGRELAYAEYGDPDAPPVFYFHGFPGSRLEPELAQDSGSVSRVRLIAADRPGFGRSTDQPQRRILDWPDDVAQLADALDVDRFACMGVSGGGPYALACAYAIPQRLTSVACVAGVGPPGIPHAYEGTMISNRVLMGVARHSQAVTRLLMRPMVRQLKRGSFSAERMKKMLPEPDCLLLERPEVLEFFLRGARESLRQGLRAVAEEAQLYSRDWGFRLEEIDMEVHLYQGELDRNVSPAMGHWQAEALPNCDAHFYPDEGHLSLIFNRSDEVLADLL